jgi:mersacidin/lichenicidin family type 2 lantibiotic
MPDQTNAARVWREAGYGSRLSAAEEALLPEHPAGIIELSDVDLDEVVGGLPSNTPHTGCCPHCQVCDGGTP